MLPAVCTKTRSRRHFSSLEWFTDVDGLRVIHFLPLVFRAIHFFFIAGLYVIHRCGSLFIAEGFSWFTLYRRGRNDSLMPLGLMWFWFTFHPRISTIHWCRCAWCDSLFTTGLATIHFSSPLHNAWLLKLPGFVRFTDVVSLEFPEYSRSTTVQFALPDPA